MRTERPRWGSIGRYALLLLTALVVLLPIYIAVAIAIQPGARLVEFPALLIPTSLHLGAFTKAFDDGHLGRYLTNSVIVTGLIVTAQVLTSILAAYAFAFVAFPGKRIVFTVFLATLMVPLEATIVANYETVQHLGWLDSYPALVVPFMATAFGTFLLRQAFLGVPNDLRDAAALDGFGHLGFLRHVAVPLARPAIAAFTVFSFLLAWNQYLWPLLVTNDDRHRTVQIGLKTLVSTRLEELNVTLAGALLAALPIFVLLIVFQRQLVRGLTSGAVKG
jgi:ABC-type glycerol-3-phosphate transport system permease component